MTEKTPEIISLDKTIECFVPVELNINYLGEWVVKIDSLCYGVLVRGIDKKVMITYNIDPAGLDPRFFTPCGTDKVPKIIFDMLQRKLSTDIMRMDNMMHNLVINKGLLNHLFNFAELNKLSSELEFEHEVSEYSAEDAAADKKKEHIAAKNQVHSMNPARATNRKKAKKAKEARKKNKTK